MGEIDLPAMTAPSPPANANIPALRDDFRKLLADAQDAVLSRRLLLYSKPVSSVGGIDSNRAQLGSDDEPRSGEVVP
jgi:hypothetical protein